MQNEKNKKTLLVTMACVLICTVLVHWWLNSIEYNEKLALTDEIVATKQKVTQDSIRLEKYASTVAGLNDSLMRYKTEGGYLQIQLNRKETEIKEAIGRYKMAKADKDTVKIMAECDSVLLGKIPEYVIIDSSWYVANDSVFSVLNSLIAVKDKTIAEDSKISNSLIVDLLNCQKENGELKVKQKVAKEVKKKDRKDKLFIGIFGFVAGAIATLLAR